MFSADLGGAPPAATPAATDPPFQKVALLLHGDGTNGAQNNTFLDSSTNNFTITRTGNVAQGTFSPFSLAEGQWSNYFDGSGDYLTVPASTALDFGTGDFTVEWWQYWNGTQSSYGTLYNNNYGSGPNFLIQTNANVNQYIVYMNGTSTSITESSAASANQWYHYAVVRNGTTVTIYRNGVSTGSTTYSGNVGSSVTTYIGTGGSGPYTITASYLSNFRIVKGTAVYTSNFTPPTSALTAISGTSLLTCQSNRFKDNSSNNFTITPAGDTKVTAFSPFAPSAAYSASTNGGSGYFDGSGDYLSTPPTGQQFAPAGDFTVSAWINISGTPSTSKWYGIVTNYTTNISTDWGLFVNSSRNVEAYTNGGAVRILSSVIDVGAWNYVSLVRSGSTITLYINGVSQGTYTQSGTFGTTSKSVYIGNQNTEITTNMYGYITDVRLVDGSAITAVPTAPLTAVPGTQLLLNCTNAGIIDNAGKNDIETVGNAQISTSVKKYGTGSMYFDGTGDYLTATTPDGFTPGTSDFTIEAWIYPASATLGNIVSQRSSGGISFRYNSNGTLNFFYSGGLSQFSSTLTAPLNTWTHVAATRSGNTVKLWVNGVNSGTNTGYSASISGSLINIGSYQSAEFFNGYIDDLRITKGQALYTSDFTPPTQAFPNV